MSISIEKNEDVIIHSWLNNQLLSDEKWEVHSIIEKEIFYVFIKNPETKQELKLKIQKIIKP